MLPQKLPFYFKSHTGKGNDGFPDALPFDVYFDDELQMYRQRTSEGLKKILHEVYEIGSLVDGSISNESGFVYVEKVSAFIKYQIKDFIAPDVLEIGCGSGIILKALKDCGANLLGIEPGNHEKVAGLEGIEIINDFFPTQKIKKKFDLIFSLLVLEHFEDPMEFLRSQAEFLKNDGKLIFGVPNCEPFLNTGDISIFIHEHYSYFTKKSIYRIAALAGLKIENVDIIEGILIVSAKKKSEPKDFEVFHDAFNSASFEEKISELNEKIVQLFSNYKENDIAVYVPGRALNTLFLAKKFNCRFIDDNSEIHGKYLPAFNNPIENFKEMAQTPPKVLFIFSRTFGDRIKEKCNSERNLDNVRILTLNDLE